MEYIILGTSHIVQESGKFESCAAAILNRYEIRLVAEEYLCDTESRICSMAKRRHIPYLQVDLWPNEWAEYGIDREMKTRSDAPCMQNVDIRLSHADSIRENFWLDKIEICLKAGSVLVICGYLHLDFVAGNIQARGSLVAEKCTYPANLLGRMPQRTLSPDELQKYLQEHSAASEI